MNGERQIDMKSVGRACDLSIWQRQDGLLCKRTRTIFFKHGEIPISQVQASSGVQQYLESEESNVWISIKYLSGLFAWPETPNTATDKLWPHCSRSFVAANCFDLTDYHNTTGYVCIYRVILTPWAGLTSGALSFFWRVASRQDVLGPFCSLYLGLLSF